MHWQLTNHTLRSTVYAADIDGITAHLQALTDEGEDINAMHLSLVRVAHCKRHDIIGTTCILCDFEGWEWETAGTIKDGVVTPIEMA